MDWTPTMAQAFEDFKLTNWYSAVTRRGGPDAGDKRWLLRLRRLHVSRPSLTSVTTI
jgi:hypothetical protein